MGTYEDIFRSSTADSEAFWLGAADAIDWLVAPTSALDASRPPFYRWFPDGELNVCHNALDRHVDAGRGDAGGADLRLPVTGTAAHVHLRASCATRSPGSPACCVGLGVGQGRPGGDLHADGARGGRSRCWPAPGSARCTRWCSAGSRRGSSPSGSTTPQPKVIVSASCGIEGKRVIEYKPLLDRAIELAAHKPRALRDPAAPAGPGIDSARPGRRLGGRDGAPPTPADCVPVEATDPLYILYTSGTTGKPKGVVRDNGGYAVALRWSMPNVYDVDPGETMFTASDVGWVVGHSYIVYAPLLAGATTVLYEGKPVGTPDAGAVLAGRRRARREGACSPRRPRSGRSRRRTRTASSSRRLRPVGAAVPVPGRRAARPGDLPLGDGAARHPGDRPLVADRDRLADRREPGAASSCCRSSRARRPCRCPAGTCRCSTPTGAAGRRPAPRARSCVKLPLPPGSLPTLCGATTSGSCSPTCRRSTGYYLTGDGGYLDDDGYLFVMGRTDDVINVAGHRLSTGAMEEVLAAHPAVAECAVIGVADALKGQVPRGFVVLKAGVERDRARARRRAGADGARPDRRRSRRCKDVAVVAALPKTRSGKILRKTMRGIADGARRAGARRPSTTPAVLDALRPVLRRE